ncbi:hypothetical protein N8Z47_05165 [Salibacteraceae bacterium]|nr:hypothetical protein [Salibacteraceae bacterium]
MRQKIYISLLFCLTLGISTSIAQQASTQDSDVVAQLGYHPQDILNDWINWEQNQPAELEFLGQYMLDHQVPQVGLYGLNLHDTWYWWISNNQGAIQEYINLKEQ